jgi:hypothetical protein
MAFSRGVAVSEKSTERVNEAGEREILSADGEWRTLTAWCRAAGYPEHIDMGAAWAAGEDPAAYGKQ